MDDWAQGFFSGMGVILLAFILMLTVIAIVKKTW